MPLGIYKISEETLIRTFKLLIDYCTLCQKKSKTLYEYGLKLFVFRQSVWYVFFLQKN